MKGKLLWLVLLVVVIALAVVMVRTAYSMGSNILLMPLIFKNGSYVDTPPPTITSTPKPTKTEPPPPTATPTPVYASTSTYEWVYVGRAENSGETIEVIGVIPGYCYDMIFDHWEDHPKGKLAVLRAKEIADGYWWCTSPPYNPAAPWPPPQFPPPTTLPPEFGYGEIFKKVFDWNAAIVCGIKEGTTTLNCIETQK